MRKGTASLCRVCLSFPLLILASGCGGAKSAPQSPTVKRDQNLITREELNARDFGSVYDAITSLRATWLRARGQDSLRRPSQVQVYLNNQRLGGVEQLKSMQPGTVQSIRHIDGIEATSRFGTDHGAGVIMIVTR